MRRQILVDIQTVRCCENPSGGSHSDKREQGQSDGLDDANSRFINTPKQLTKTKQKYQTIVVTELTSAILIQACTGKLIFLKARRSLVGRGLLGVKASRSQSTHTRLTSAANFYTLLLLLNIIPRKLLIIRPTAVLLNFNTLGSPKT